MENLYQFMSAEPQSFHHGEQYVFTLSCCVKVMYVGSVPLQQVKLLDHNTHVK